jgi:DNA-directed RNA polymerase specialized sigma24 family protein
VSQTLASLGQAREEFLAMIEGIRPDLHRYCARLTGSVIDGEDIVQAALAKALYALSLQPEVPPRVTAIRDFRYVPYIATDAAL